MTEELAKQLTEHYEHCIKMIQPIDSRYTQAAKDLCKSNKIHHGLCYAAAALFNKDLYSCDWVRSHVKLYEDDYITAPPNHCNTVSDIITALQIRVDILKTFKNENNGTQ